MQSVHCWTMRRGCVAAYAVVAFMAVCPPATAAQVAAGADARRAAAAERIQADRGRAPRHPSTATDGDAASLDILWLPEPEACLSYEEFENLPKIYYRSADPLTKLTRSSDASKEVITRAYDGNGNVTYREARITYSYSDAPSWHIIRCAYNVNNQLVRKTGESSYGGAPTYEITYNDRHQTQTEVIYSDFDGDSVVDYREVVRFEYDRLGRPIRRSLEWDTNADGAIEGHSAYLVTYDAYGHRSRVVLEIYRGSTDIVRSRETYYADWDAQHRVLRNGVEDDLNADGVPELWTRFVYTYDGARLAHQTYELDYRNENYGPADGVPDYRFDAFFEYDATDRVTRTLYLSHYNEDFGSPESRDDYLYEYDGYGRLTRQTWKADNEADGAVDSTWSWTWTYNRNGGVDEILQEYNTGYDISSYERQVFQWDDLGHMHKMTQTSFITGEKVERQETATYQYAKRAVASQPKE